MAIGTNYAIEVQGNPYNRVSETLIGGLPQGDRAVNLLTGYLFP
jgi:hypothetical protein